MTPPIAYKRVPFGEETRANFHAPRCHDCGAFPGEIHVAGCDVEECSICRHQFITCECERYAGDRACFRRYPHLAHTWGVGGYIRCPGVRSV